MVCTWRVQDEGGRPQRGRSPCCGLWDWPEPGLATPPDSQTSSVSGDQGGTTTTEGERDRQRCTFFTIYIKHRMKLWLRKLLHNLKTKQEFRTLLLVSLPNGSSYDKLSHRVTNISQRATTVLKPCHTRFLWTVHTTYVCIPVCHRGRCPAVPTSS